MKKAIFTIAILTCLILVFLPVGLVSAAPATVTLDPAWEKTSNRLVDTTLGTTLPCTDSYWHFTSPVWDGPSTNGYGAAIPGSFGSWAYWDVRPPTGHQVNTFYHYWFRTNVTVVAPLAQDVKLVNKADPSMLSVNDDIYVYVNGTLAACGGTAALVGYSVPAGFVNSIRDTGRSLATDGWLINGGLAIPKSAFATGSNQICVLTEDFWDWGGLAQPVFELTYADYTLSGVTPTPAFNPVETEHNVNVQVTPAVAGVVVTFVVEGANAQTGTATTNSSGIASFAYTGNSAGVDSIWAYIDLNTNGSWDEGEPHSTADATKYWFQENFLTGGGTIKDANGKKVLWTIAGNIGFLPDGSIVGNFNIVDHANKNQYKAHNTFTALAFSGDPTFSPPASYHIATFTGNFTDKNGVPVVLTFVIMDNDESGGGADTIAIDGIGFPAGDQYLSGGNYQVHDGFKG